LGLIRQNLEFLESLFYLPCDYSVLFLQNKPQGKIDSRTIKLGYNIFIDEGD